MPHTHTHTFVDRQLLFKLDFDAVNKTHDKLCKFLQSGD